ncbi:MAG: hypothetical protein WBO39_04180 [Ferruginibacter sp.]
MRIILFFIVVLLIGCEKDQYKSVSGNVKLTGYVYLVDTINNTFPVPLAGQKIYLNSGSDSSTYIYQATTDLGGKYSIPFLQSNKAYVLFTRYINNSIEYEGVKKIDGGASNDIIYTDLTIHAKFTNGLSLLFTDSLNGPLPNLPFRLYTSRIAAQYDSVLYAVTVASSDINARYSKVNVVPAKYYTVASKIIGSLTMRVFDSVIVAPIGLTRKTMQLH